MPFKAPTDPKKHAEAVRWFRKRVPVTQAAFDKLSEDAKRQSFAIGGTKQMRVVQTVFDEVSASISRGEHGQEAFEKFKARISDKLRNTYADKNSAELRTSWGMATQTALNVGRWEQQALADEDEFPYRELIATLDNRTTDLCRSLDGTIRRIDDSFWLITWPPLHWLCRTIVQLRAAGEVDRATPIPREHTVAAGFGQAPPFRPDWEPNADDYDTRVFRVYERKVKRMRDDAAD